MKGLVFVGALAALGFAQGCGHAPDHINPSASYPDFGTGAEREQAKLGELVIETDENRELPVTADRDLNSAALTAPSYTLYDERGNRINGIRSHSVHLPAGRDLIRLDEGPQKEEVFWVTIKPGRRTVVDLRELGEHRRKLTVN